MPRKNPTVPKPAPDPLMTLSEVAAYLQVAERTVYLWAQNKTLPGKKLGNLWRFRRSEIDATIDRQTTTTTAPQEG